MSYPFDCITDFIFVENEMFPCDIILIPGGSHPQLMEKAVELLENGMAKYILPCTIFIPKSVSSECNVFRLSCHG